MGWQGREAASERGLDVADTWAMGLHDGASEGPSVPVMLPVIIAYESARETFKLAGRGVGPCMKYASGKYRPNIYIK